MEQKKIGDVRDLTVASQDETAADKQLFTIAELAEQFKLSLPGMQKRIAKLGLEPVVPAKSRGPGLKDPALYSLNALCKIQEEERILQEKQRAADQKAVALLKDSQKDLVLENIFAAMGPLELMTASAALYQRSMLAFQDMAKTQTELDRVYMLVDELEATNFDLVKENALLKVSLNESDNAFTCESYAVEVLKKGISRGNAAAVTRALHAKGKQHLGRTKANENTFSACVWSKEDLDYAAEQGWFD